MVPEADDVFHLAFPAMSAILCTTQTKESSHVEDVQWNSDMTIKMRYGNTNTFLIPCNSGYLLVDTDYAGTLSAFYKALKTVGVQVKDITYVLATHYHPDHMGLIPELMNQGIKLLLIDTQTNDVHYSDPIFAREKSLRFVPIDESKAEVVSCRESRAFLANIGIAGEIISTSSHSRDSVSLVLDDGDCLVGDLEPMEYLLAYDDNPALKADWDAILSFCPKRILHSHANVETL